MKHTVEPIALPDHYFDIALESVMLEAGPTRAVLVDENGVIKILDYLPTEVQRAISTSDRDG